MPYRLRFTTSLFNEVNTAPVLVTVPDQTMAGGGTLALTVVATDGDLPPNTLRFSLESGPGGSTIDPETGAFFWLATAAYTPGVHPVTIVVTDDGTPPLSGRHTFIITVTGLDPTPTLLSGDSGLTQGGFRLLFTSAADWRYVVEASSDFKTWTPVGDVLSGTGGTLLVIDQALLPEGQRFYRVRVVE